jgi:hypothetical protein
MRLPVIVLTHGEVAVKCETNDQSAHKCMRDRTASLYSCINGDGIDILPVFTDAEKAYAYRIHSQRLMAENILPFSVTGEVEPFRPDLRTYAIEKPEHFRDLLQFAATLAKVQYVALNPVPDQQMLCYEPEEFLGLLCSASSVDDSSVDNSSSESSSVDNSSSESSSG